MLMHAPLMLSLVLGTTVGSAARPRPTSLPPGSVEAKALAFFERIEDRSFDDYLRRVRLPQVSSDFKAKVLAHVVKSDEVKVSKGMKIKLAALAPILEYHERDTTIEIKVIGARELYIRLQGRAMLLISEKALALLSSEELQAVVAHELGHEYFWGELMDARRQKQHDVMREIEMLCDGIAVITLHRLGLDPVKLISALARIRTLNTRITSTDPFYHPQPDARSRFVNAMNGLVRRRSPVLAYLTQKKFVERHLSVAPEYN